MNFDEMKPPPAPPNIEEARRWEETRLRRRLLDGKWENDLVKRLQMNLGTTRRQAWNGIDMSANPFRVICRELSCLYDQNVQILHEDDSADELISSNGPIAESGLWASMRRFQAWVIGCREYLMRIDVNSDGKVRYRPVCPDMVHCIANPDAPDEPAAVFELRARKRNDGTKRADEMIWTWDVIDLRNPLEPVYKIIDAQSFYSPSDEAKWVDLTERYMGRSLSGYDYPYFTKEYTPVLPYVLYHAERLGDRLWDPYEMKETVEASFQLSIGYSMLFHVIKSASWPQRWIANARVAGLDIAGDSSRAEIVTDPAAVLMLEPIDDGQVMVGQWQAGADAQKLEATLQSYASRVAQDAGLSASDVQRQSGNARSGYAIALTSSGKREVQRRFLPQFKHADQQLIRLTAIMLNRATGSNYPEQGYELVYGEIPLSPQERESKRKDVFERLDRGLISLAQAKAELSGLSIRQAAKEITRVRALRQGFND